jgi:RNA polymerase sigma-70 factor, ECF subfamily
MLTVKDVPRICVQADETLRRREVEVIGGEVVSLEEARLARRGRDARDGLAPQRDPDAVDDETVRAAAAGDRRAFETIVTVYEPRLRILARRLLRDLSAVDDVLQDVFLRAYRGLHEFRGDAALGTWLHRITYTSCVSVLRERRAELVPLDEAESLVGVQGHGEDLAERLRLERALATLDAEHLVAVLMVDRDGYDYDTVARVLEIPVGTVASRLNAARRRLRAELAWDDDAAIDAAETKERP